MYALYGAHDLTHALVLRGLDQHPRLWPPFASYMVLELWHHSSTNTSAVRVIYNDDVLRIAGCSLANSTVCTLADFDALLARRFTVNYQQDCLL